MLNNLNLKKNYYNLFINNYNKDNKLQNNILNVHFQECQLINIKKK